MESLLDLYGELIPFVLLGIIAVLFIWCIILSVQVTKLNRKYKKFMRSATGKSFETVVLEQMDRVESSMERVNLLNQEFNLLRENMDKCIQKHSVIRYNAFSDSGGDQSFSIAMLDNNNNGVIVTGLVGRSECYTYAKPVENGSSKYPLSTEEDIVLSRCVKRVNK